MTIENSPIILTQSYLEKGIFSFVRLIHTVDIFQNTDVFSVFMTSKSAETQTEDFIYDISRERDEAEKFFRMLCEQKATASSLQSLAEAFVDC